MHRMKLLPFALLAPFLFGAKCTNGGGSVGNAWVQPICVPSFHGEELCPYPSVTVNPGAAVVFAVYYTESGIYPDANEVGEISGKINWNDPIGGATNSMWIVAAQEGWYQDPVSGADYYNDLPGRCGISVENNLELQYTFFHIHKLGDPSLPCDTPIMQPDPYSGVVRPKLIATMLVQAGTVEGFSESLITERVSRRVGGTAARPFLSGDAEVVVAAE